jgi:hypothetical protein
MVRVIESAGPECPRSGASIRIPPVFARFRSALKIRKRRSVCRLKRKISQADPGRGPPSGAARRERRGGRFNSLDGLAQPSPPAVGRQSGLQGSQRLSGHGGSQTADLRIIQGLGGDQSQRQDLLRKPRACRSSSSSSRLLWALPAMTIVTTAIADSSQIMPAPII